MVVAFPHSRGARISSASPAAHLRKGSQGLEVTVPKSAHSGNIMVLLSHGRYSSSYGPISVVRYALHPPAPKDPPARRRSGGERAERQRVRTARACGSGT